MPKQSEIIAAEFKSGIFIILTIILLIFIILWFRYFAIKPYMTVIASFKKTGPIETGTQVYYKGVSVGKISKIKFSDDFTHTLVYVDIYYKNLKIPSNIYAETKTEGLAGQTYLEIEYPNNPSPRLLANNTVIHGKTPFGLSDLQDYIEAQMKNGNIKRLFTDFEESFKIQIESGKEMGSMADNISNILKSNRKEIDTFFNKGTKSVTSLSEILDNLNDVIGNPKTKSNLNLAISSAQSAAKNIDELTGDKELKKNLKETVTNFNELGKGASNTLNKANQTLDQFGGTFTKMNNLIDDAHNLGSSSITGTLQNANNTITHINCLTTGMSQMLSQRFLLLRLLFGKPGANLEQCKSSTKAPCQQIPCQSQPVQPKSSLP